MAEKMTQDQIDLLISGLKNGDIAKTGNRKRYICKYCRMIINLKMDNDSYVPKMFLYGCKRNITGHCYYSEEYLKSRKII